LIAASYMRQRRDQPGRRADRGQRATQRRIGRTGGCEVNGGGAPSDDGVVAIVCGPLHSTIRHYLDRLNLVAGQQLIGTATPVAHTLMQRGAFRHIASSAWRVVASRT